MLGLLLLVATAGCSEGQFLRLGMPKPVTSEGKYTINLWQGSWIAAFAVGALVWGLIVWTVIFHRKRSDRMPQQVRYNLPIEILYTVVPFIMVSVLFYFTVREGSNLRNTPEHPKMTVDVTGFQWSWKFHYEQSGVNITGVPVEKPGQKPTLVLPKGVPVRFNLYSSDVVHSFWVPAFLFKRDVVPGHPNHFAVTPTKEGTYEGRCSELCGTYHSRMLFRVKVVSKSEFQDFIARQQAKRAAGSTQ